MIGCGGGGGSVAPATPTPTVSFSPNPKIRSATVAVTRLGSPAPNVAVQISTPKSSSSPRPGTPFGTQYTKSNGETKFNHLTPSKTYCWVAILGQNQTSSQCAPWFTWQSGTIPLGT